MSNFLTGVDDFLGGIVNSKTGSAVLDIYKQEKAADIAADQAKATAAAEAARLKAAQAAATPAAASVGGIPPKTLLIGGAVVLGLGVVIWAATRRG